jgi:hypothetical protein
MEPFWLSSKGYSHLLRVGHEWYFYVLLRTERFSTQSSEMRCDPSESYLIRPF